VILQKQLEILEYFNYMGGLTNDARYSYEIKSRIAMAKAAVKKKALHQQIGFIFKDHHHHHLLLSLMGHRASTKRCHLVLSLAILFSSLHLFPFSNAKFKDGTSEMLYLEHSFV
jgi:hypothetical protein